MPIPETADFITYISAELTQRGTGACALIKVANEHMHMHKQVSLQQECAVQGQFLGKQSVAELYQVPGRHSQ
jgi:hypothetical protein